MARPTNELRILAPPDPLPSTDPPFKKHSRAAASGATAGHPTAAKLDPTSTSKSSHLSNPISFSRLPSHSALTSQRPKNPNPPPAIKDSHSQAKSLTVSAMFDSSKVYVVKSKPQPKKVTSVCNDKSRKSCKELDKKKIFYEKEKASEGVDGKGLCPMLKGKELKELQEEHHFDSLKPTVALSLRGGRRRSFGGSQVELADIFANNGVKVVSVDMPPFMQIHAVDCARKAHDSMEKFTSKTLALSLKREFDGVYGPAWHCIVGTSFGSFVTHSVGGFLYFSMDQKLYILLFKTTVQRAD